MTLARSLASAAAAGLFAAWAQPLSAQAAAGALSPAVLGDWMFAYEFSRRCPGLDTLDLAVLDQRLSQAQLVPAPGEDSSMMSGSVPGATGYAFAQRERQETQAARAAPCGEAAAKERVEAARAALAPFRQGWLRVSAGLIADPPRRLAAGALAGIDPTKLQSLVAAAPPDAAAKAFADETLRAIRRNDRRGRNLGEIYVGSDNRTAEVADQAGMALLAARIALGDAPPSALLVASLAPNRPSIAPTLRAFWDAFADGPLRARSPVSQYASEFSGAPCAMLAARLALMRDGRVLVQAPKAYGEEVRFTLLLRDPDLGPAPTVVAPGQIDDWRWTSLQKSLSGAPPEGAVRDFSLEAAPAADAAAMADPPWRAAEESLGSVLIAPAPAGALLARLGPTDAAVLRVEGGGCASFGVHVPLAGLGHALSWGDGAR